MSVVPLYEHDHLCAHVISKNAALYKNRTAVVCGEDRLTWQELDLKTNRVANALLGLGLTKGDKVCTFMPNSMAAFLLFWGAIKAGCVIVPLNVMLDAPTLARLTVASDGVIFFASPETMATVMDARSQIPSIAENRYYLSGGAQLGWQNLEAFIAAASDDPPAVSLNSEDTMTVIYTSGTTGTPKGIEHSHFARLNYCYGFGAGLGINRYSVAVCATPIYASGTWITMLPTMYYGGKVVLLPKFSPEAFLSAVAEEGGTHTFMVPTQYIAILQAPLDDRSSESLQVMVSAGQLLSPVTRQALAAKFAKSALYEVYGMTEGFFTIAIPKDRESGKDNTVGKPGFLEDIRIVGDHDKELAVGEIGEIVAYGAGMMKGYYNRPDLTSETVWLAPGGRTYLRSGDLGHVDEDGFLYVNGRKKDMIKSGGINIFAVDIEDEVMKHPAVSEVAVIGRNDPKWGETPIGIVILKDANAVASDELKAWVNERVAKYQRLTDLIFVEDFPRATYGKIQKEALRKTYSGEPIA